MSDLVVMTDAKANPEENEVSQLLAEPPLNAEDDVETVEKPQHIIEAGLNEAHLSPPCRSRCLAFCA